MTTTTETFARRCGALGSYGTSARWRVWAPRASQVELVVFEGDQQRRVEMRHEEGGYFTHERDGVEDGQRYAFSLNGGANRADPCSLWQPQGVQGPSAIFRPDRFEWSDQDWRGIARQDLAFYELHVGTFTREGTFEAIIPRLAQLRDLGITAIEIMPINEFPGTRNWGYDGVLPYAAHHCYGGPAGLLKLVDAAHAQGLAVILDVVYNHFGPEDNYLHEFGPYFTDKYKTPWGMAVNFDDADCDPVRDFVLDNARMWLSEFHVDGLRLDAVHAIFDMGARHILRAIHDVAQEVSQQTGRHVHVIGESDLNDPRMILSPERGGQGLDAQWADDFHHSVHALLTGERRGYYADYGEAAHVAAALQRPFVYEWNYSPHRKRKHGAPLPADVTGDQFVVCIQNHDQVGNRARGERLTHLLHEPAKRRLAASLMLLSPYLPLIFMGEEYGEERPFPFFCSFCGEELIRCVREGRCREFADFVDSPDDIPDPSAQGTYASAKLTWDWSRCDARGLRKLYTDLLAARRKWPALRDFTNRQVRFGEPVLELVRGAERQKIVAYFNLCERDTKLPESRDPHALLFSSEWSQYSGKRNGGKREILLPWECLVFSF